MLGSWIIKKLGLVTQSEMNKRSAVESLLTNDMLNTFNPQLQSPKDKNPTYYYRTNPWCYACVNTIVSAISQLPYKLVDTLSPEIEIDDPDLIAFIDNPNSETNYVDFISQVALSIELSGMSFIEPVNDADGIQAYSLNSTRFEIKNTSPRNWDFRYTVNGQTHVFQKDEIVYSKLVDPGNDFLGLSPLTPALKTLSTWERIETYNENFIANGARPAGFFHTENESVDDNQCQRLEARFNQKYAGDRNTGKTLFLSHGIQYTQLSATPKDMDYLQLVKYCRETLLATLRLPPVQIGVFEYANYANSLIQKRIFWEDGLMPRIKKMQSIMNSLLTFHFGEGIAFEFDLSNVEALQANKAEKATEQVSLVTAGIIDRNEARENYGKEPREGADILLVPMGSMPVAEAGSSLEFEPDVNADEFSSDGDIESQVNNILEGANAKD